MILTVAISVLGQKWHSNVSRDHELGTPHKAIPPINQIIFGFNNNTSTVNAEPDFSFYIQKIDSTNNYES